MTHKGLGPSLLTLAIVLGCSDESGSSVDGREEEVTSALKESISKDLASWHEGALALCDAAPSTAWDSTSPAVAPMRQHWREARAAYEHIEGAIAPLYPDLDFATDARYDDYLSELGTSGDLNPFDAEGVVGMHGIERILYADNIPATVVELESSLPGYAPATFPTTDAQAQAFKAELCARLITDVGTLRTSWDDPATKIDLALAFQGLTDLMGEQAEKVNKAATGEEESRYSQLTMADLRTNLEGAKAAYAIFSPWVVDEGGAEIDGRILEGFAALDEAYAAVDGDAIPTPPVTWNPTTPSENDLETPFGRLWSAVQQAVDPERDGSVVFEMSEAGALLGLAP